MKKIFLLLLFAASAMTVFAQPPAITGTTLMEFYENNVSWRADVDDLAAYLAAGGGTVTNFSSGNLAPLFTTSVADPTTTPAQSFTLSNAGANTYFGNATGSPAAPSYTAAAALTKVDDTNVTATLGGAPTTALLTAASITLGWTGTLAVARGGIGVGTITGLMQGNGTGAVTGITNSSTVGQILRVTGASTYAWGALDLGDSDAITGTLPVGNGGTGLTAVGSDFTFLGSNGTANFYGTPAITNTSAAISIARSGSTINFNIPDADASFRGTVSTGTQTFAGAKTFSGAVTVQGLLTGSAGVIGTATASVASIDAVGVPARSYAAITTNTTMDHTHNLVGIGTLSGDITVSLPACNSTNDRHWYNFTKLGSDAFGVIFDPNGAETFTDNASTKTIYGQNNSFSCQCISASAKWTVGR